MKMLPQTLVLDLVRYVWKHFAMTGMWIQLSRYAPQKEKYISQYLDDDAGNGAYDSSGLLRQVADVRLV